MTKRKIFCFLLYPITLALSFQSPCQDQISVAEFLPLQTGNYWEYRNNSFINDIVTVLPGSVVINGTATKVLSNSDGTASYYSNDSNGIRLHREITGENETITLNPPWLMVGPTATIGQTFSGSGRATVTSTVNGNMILNYIGNITVSGLEDISVPAGQFNSIRLNGTLQLSGSVNGQFIQVIELIEYWTVKYIGPVKQYLNVDGDIEDSVLISYFIDHDEDGIDDKLDTDKDGDGISDIIEIRYGIDPYDPKDATADNDNDGLDNISESKIGTNLNNADTDHDNIPDKDELDAGTNPLINEAAVLLINIFSTEN